MLDLGEAEFQIQREDFQGKDRAGVPVEDVGPEEDVTMPREGNVAFKVHV